MIACRNLFTAATLTSCLLVQVAKPKTVMNILKQAYGDNKAAVNDELVQVVLDPGLQVAPGFV